ncbi:MAG: hypothetical protein GXP63_02335 [DPANN group archaeon]|nr:hypothetical protein [DPANN group archaeon]
MMTPNDVKKLVERTLRGLSWLNPHLKEVRLVGSQAAQPDRPVRPFHDVDILLVFHKDSPWWIKAGLSQNMADASFNWDASMKDTLLAPIDIRKIYPSMVYSIAGMTFTQIATQLNMPVFESIPAVGSLRDLAIPVDIFSCTEGWKQPESWKDTPLKKKWRSKRKEIFRKSVLLNILALAIPGLVMGTELLCRIGYKLDKRLNA